MSKTNIKFNSIYTLTILYGDREGTHTLIKVYNNE